MDVEQALVQALQSVRTARTKEEFLRNSNRELATEVQDWKKRYEQALADQQRLHQDLANAQQHAQTLKAQLSVHEDGPRRFASNLRARNDSSGVRMRVRRLDSGNARLHSSLSCRGGVLPLPYSRSYSNLQCDDEDSDYDHFPQSNNQLPSRHVTSAQQDSIPIRRTNTLDISGLMSMFVTANLLQQESINGAATSQQPQPQAPQNANGTGPGRALPPVQAQGLSVSVPAGSFSPGPVEISLDPSAPLSSKARSGSPGLTTSKVRSQSTSGHAVEAYRDSPGPPTGRQTYHGEPDLAELAVIPGHANMQPHVSMSSVSLVDNDGTSGVGLAAAAAVAAAAARAWAAAATQQRQHVHQQQRQTSGVSVAQSQRSVSGSDLSLHDGALGEGGSVGRGSTSQLSALGQGRKPGKVGYKLVASVYREAPAISTPKAPVPIPKHAHSTANITSLAAGSAGSSNGGGHMTAFRHSHTHSNFLAATDTQPRSQSASPQPPTDLGPKSEFHSDSVDNAPPRPRSSGALPSAFASQHLPHTSTDCAPAPTVVNGDGAATSMVSASSMSMGSPDKDAHRLSVGSSKSLSPPQQQAAAHLQRYVSERRGGWYNQGGVTSDVDTDGECDLDPRHSVKSPTASTAQHLQQASDTSRQGQFHYRDGRIDLTTGERRSVEALHPEISFAQTQQPYSGPSQPAGTILQPQSLPIAAAIAAPTAASALATAGHVPLPPLVRQTSEAGGQLQGSFTVLEPATCPGCHLATTSAVESAVRHAVPAVVAGISTHRGSSTISVLQRDSVDPAHTTADTRPTRSTRTSLDLQPQPASAAMPAAALVTQQRIPAERPAAPTTPSQATPPQPQPSTRSESSGSHDPVPTCTVCSKDMNKSTALTLHWLSPPRTALVVCKLSAAVYPLLNTVVRWLRARDLSVYVEPETYPHVDPDILRGSPQPAIAASQGEDSVEGCPQGVLSWPEGRCPNHSIPDEVAQDLDFVVVLGGDGTLLWTCHVFGNRAVPPLVPFNMGSLGFLTPFPPSQLDEILSLVLQGGFPMILRHRLHATIVRVPREGEGGGQSGSADSYWADGHCATEKVVLNEVVVDRGISPFLTNLECYCDGNFVTHVQGDGLIISTPTGSTAYSLAAGGSMVHPQVPGILFTPVCPHSLSFRPLVFPDHVQLCIQVPQGARSQMYCSFDGKDRQELNAGDAILIRMSQWPIPTVCSRDPSRDWFTGIREGLHWNVRRIQGHAG